MVFNGPRKVLSSWDCNKTYFIIHFHTLFPRELTFCLHSYLIQHYLNKSDIEVRAERGCLMPVNSNAQKSSLATAIGESERCSLEVGNEGARFRLHCDFSNDITRLEPSVSK